MEIEFKSDNNSGQGLIEYGAILALIAAVIILVLNLTGVSIRDLYCRVIASLGVEGVCETAYCQDDFNDLNNWSLRYDRSWDVVDGKLCNTKNGETQIYNLCSQEVMPEHYAVNLNNVVLDEGWGYGIFYNLQGTDPVEGYAFQYDPGYGSGEFVVRRWANGWEVNPPIARKSVDMEWYDIEHDLRLEINGSQVKAYLDGEFITEFEDDSFTGGSAGLRTWDSTRVCLDSFSIDPLY